MHTWVYNRISQMVEQDRECAEGESSNLGGYWRELRLRLANLLDLKLQVQACCVAKCRVIRVRY